MSTVIYTDGACSGNPGPGGWGAVVLENEQFVSENFGGEADTTNNRMELTAVIEALRPYPDNFPLCIITDSKYVQDGINSWIHGWKRNGWRTSNKKPVKNQDLWQALDQQSMRLKVEWKWVKGHAGNRWNERADVLARQGVASVL